MSQRRILGEKAVAYFLEGYNCAQSVLLTMFEHWNGKNDLVPRIATGFGGGIGRCGHVCGALVGGVMALSVRFGTNEPSPDAKKRTYSLVRRLYRRFEKQNGSVLCRELIGYDLSDPNQLKKASETKVFEKTCTVFVKRTVESVFELSQSKR